MRLLPIPNGRHGARPVSFSRWVATAGKQRMRRNLLVLVLVAAAQQWPFASSAQSPKRVPIVGLLTVTAGPSDLVAMNFRDGLRQLGYVDGQISR